MSIQESVQTEIYENILETMGNTPLVRLNRLARGLKAQIIAKVEYFNPGGSVKDRIGITIIEDAERQGLLKPGGTIVEATSGNTGVGLAMAAILKGYKCVFVMPDKMSEEKIRVLRAYGARVVVTPTNVEPDDPRSYYSVARRIVEETPNSILANQYHNPVNPQTHTDFTGPEIWRQTGGQIDVFVCGMGTGGTITGVARYLKQMNPKIQVVGVDPVGSILYDYFYTGQMTQAHTYKTEGIGEDFIPSNYDFSVIDDMVRVSDKESMLMTRRLVREEGIFAGNSSGAAVAGALKYAAERDLGPEKMVVVLLPDNGSRYLSKVFDDNWMRENQFLEHDWADTTINMVLDRKPKRDLITAHCDEPVGQVVTKLKNAGVSQLPVLGERGQLLGMVTEVRLLNYLLTHASMSEAAKMPIKEVDVIDATVATIPPSTPLESVLTQFSTHKVLLVTEDLPNGQPGDKRPIGIVTQIDMLDILANS
ncbi:MAG: cystathionine beta-synthase [Phototrophicales bacterium]|nr:MAG: pyridoxal-5'-phosphate-dependent protein subunit beta [Phototrophicales bacterium]RMG76088.1 MAG: cystathionine beta-synthase [Chloroflexota bacterium]